MPVLRAKAVVLSYAAYALPCCTLRALMSEVVDVACALDRAALIPQPI